MQNPPNTGTAGISHVCMASTRQGRESSETGDGLVLQSLGQISHCHCLGFIPGMGTLSGARGAASLLQNSHGSKSSCRTPNTDAIPAHMPRCMPGVRVWILTVLLESCCPFGQKSRHYLIQNRKQTALWAVSKFGLHSEGEKVKILINPSCWKNALQKHYSEWVTNHKILIIKKSHNALGTLSDYRELLFG